MRKKIIALWMYRNEGGQAIKQKLKKILEENNIQVINDFELRNCYIYNGKVFTEKDYDLSSVNLLYYMNADEQSAYQIEVLRALELSGVKVFNTWSSYYLARNKFWTNSLLKKNGINVPPSLNVSDISPVKSLAEGLWGKLIGDRGYISSSLFQELLEKNIQLITKISNNMKNKLMDIQDKLLLRKRAIIETINDQLKNISRIEHSRHRSPANFLINLLSGLIAYCHQKKPKFKNSSKIFNSLLKPKTQVNLLLSLKTWQLWLPCVSSFEPIIKKLLFLCFCHLSFHCLKSSKPFSFK